MSTRPSPLTVAELRQMWMNHETCWDFYVSVNERVKALQDAAHHCTWTPDNDPNTPDTYHSACGVAWTFTDGGPADTTCGFASGVGPKRKRQWAAMHQLSLFDAPPALIDPHDRVCTDDELFDTIELGDRRLGLRIELARHADGRMMWGTEFHTPTGGCGYRVGPKWGKFARSAIEALQHARIEIAERAPDFKHGQKVVQLLGQLDA